MNRTAIVVTFLLVAAGVAFAQQSQSDAELGLSKESVFDTPDPIVAHPVGGDPGENSLIAAYFEEGIPPLIPDTIEDMVPIHADENLCMDCHADREAIGQPVARPRRIDLANRKAPTARTTSRTTSSCARRRKT